MREIRRMAIEDFGHDHWSAFAYLETRCVNHRGRPDTRHMRVDLKRHPGKGHQLSNESTRPYPTRLRDGTEVHAAEAEGGRRREELPERRRLNDGGAIE